MGDDGGVTDPGGGGDRRRRHHRLQHRLSPDQAREAGRGPPGARAPHRRHLLARCGPGQSAPRHIDADRARALCRRPLRVAGGRDRPGDRLPPQGQHAHRPHRRTTDRDQAHGRTRRLFRRRGLRDRAERSESALSVDGCLADQGRDLHPRRRPDQPRRYRDGARQGRASGRCAHLRGDRRQRVRAQERRGLGRPHRSAAPSPAKPSSTAAASGRARSG